MSQFDAPIIISDDGESSEDEIQIISTAKASTLPNSKRKRASNSINVSSDEAPLSPRPKRARITSHKRCKTSPQVVITIDDSPTEEDRENGSVCFDESDNEEFYLDGGPSRINDIDLEIEEWNIPRVQMLTPKLRKRGETVLDAHLRQLGQTEDRFLRLRNVTGTLQSLRLCAPIVRNHQPLGLRTQQLSLNSYGSAAVKVRPKHLKSLPELRLGGCPNTITQSHGVAVIAANVHGADSDEVSPANHNGLVAISCLNGTSLPFSSPGHARLVSSVDGETGPKKIDSSTHYDRGLIYETVFDVQFDPANPDMFITVGNDNRGIVWCIEEGPDGELNVNSSLPETPGVEYEKPMGTRPHFIRFSPNSQHWSLTGDLSAFAITDAEAKFHVEFPTKESVVMSVDDPHREIASIIWGRGRSAGILFAGTESDGFRPDFDRGKQGAFHIHPSHAPTQRFYTDSRDEVEELTLNPAGDLLASFTRTCHATTPLCKKCDRRRVHSRHKLSIYSATGSGGRTTRRGKSDLLAEIALPEFKAFGKSDTANDAGLVVSAAWSPCGKYIAAARDDDSIDLFDSRYLGPLPLMRLSHQTPRRAEKYRQAYTLDGEISDCCAVLEKHPKHGITGLQWIQGAGYFGGEGLLSAGSDGCVRLWDIRQTNVCEVLVQLETSAACISVGDVSRKEISLIAADNDGLVEMRTTVT